ncbi:MAG: hypothetical protein ACFFBP_14500 [Promethearchaeota archaeon]
MSENHIDKDILEEAKKRQSWITYKGKEILYDDYRNLQGSKFPALVNAILKLTMESGKTEILGLVDVRGSYAIKETVDAFSNAGKVAGPISKKTAVLGITGVKKIFLNVVNKFSKIGAKPFDSIEDAKEWLVKDD